MQSDVREYLVPFETARAVCMVDVLVRDLHLVLLLIILGSIWHILDRVQANHKDL